VRPIPVTLREERIRRRVWVACGGRPAKLIPQPTTLLDNAATRVDELVIGVCDALGSRGRYGSAAGCRHRQHPTQRGPCWSIANDPKQPVASDYSGRKSASFIARKAGSAYIAGVGKGRLGLVSPSPSGNRSSVSAFCMRPLGEYQTRSMRSMFVRAGALTSLRSGRTTIGSASCAIH
jgi:hypothetical protein